jgi:hypothetical protein
LAGKGPALPGVQRATESSCCNSVCNIN